MEECAATLDRFGIVYGVQVLSARRTPQLVTTYARRAERRGLNVIIIVAAGSAADLAGVVAAHATLPVIGVPMKAGALNGVDALLATLQMPPGIPVATVTLGSAGPANAAVLAAQILALVRPALAAKLKAHKRALGKRVSEGDRKVQAEVQKRGSRNG